MPHITATSFRNLNNMSNISFRNFGCSMAVSCDVLWHFCFPVLTHNRKITHLLPWMFVTCLKIYIGGIGFCLIIFYWIWISFSQVSIDVKCSCMSIQVGSVLLLLSPFCHFNFNKTLVQLSINKSNQDICLCFTFFRGMQMLSICDQAAKYFSQSPGFKFPVMFEL